MPGIGHLLPVLPVALAAAARGHDVAVGCGASLATLVERSGLRHIDLGPPDLDTIGLQSLWAAQRFNLRAGGDAGPFNRRAERGRPGWAARASI